MVLFIQSSGLDVAGSSKKPRLESSNITHCKNKQVCVDNIEDLNKNISETSKPDQISNKRLFTCEKESYADENIDGIIVGNVVAKHASLNKQVQNKHASPNKLNRQAAGSEFDPIQQKSSQSWNVKERKNYEPVSTCR